MVESYSFAGSGITVLRHVQGLTRLKGNNTVIVNPEDISCAVGLMEVAEIVVDTEGATNLTPKVLQGRREILIRNQGPEIVYLGPSHVTAENGYPLAPHHAEFRLQVLAYGGIYAVTETGYANVRVLQLA